VERLVASPPPLGSMLTSCVVMFAEKHEKPRWGDSDRCTPRGCRRSMSQSRTGSPPLRGFARQRRRYAAPQLKLASKGTPPEGCRAPLSRPRDPQLGGSFVAALDR
jgi:hypothetical protein